MEVKLTRVTYEPVMAIEEAASNCYDSEPSADGHIMKACYKSGHTSVLEFAQFTFHITGVSRSLLAQITRHRISGFAVRSQRYCDEDGFGTVIPPTILKNKDALLTYYSTIKHIRKGYKDLQACGIPNEDARYVLPNACETVLEYTGNARSLANFFNERLCFRAQWEIRQLAQMMRDEIIKHDEQSARIAETAFVPKCEKYGKDCAFCTEHKSCGKYPKLKNIFEGYRSALVNPLADAISDRDREMERKING